MATTSKRTLKKTRKTGSKVKSGCSTCKIRRTKCDEQKPACLRCTTTGRECDGYPLLFRSENRFVSRTAFECSPQSELQISVHQAMGLPSDKVDRHYFSRFRHQSSRLISSFVDVHFWDQYVLRISAFRPAVQHAIVALSSQHDLYLDRATENSTDGDYQKRNSVAAYSLKQYSKAIKCLNDCLQYSSSRAETIEEVLVTCLLFICLEILQGNDLAALTHLEGGLKIFSNFAPSTKILSVFHFNGEASSGSALAQFFTRLDIQAASYVGSRLIQPFSTPTASEVSQPSLPPGLGNCRIKFTCIREARDALGTRLAYIQRFLRPTAELYKYFPHSRPPHAPITSGGAPFTNVSVSTQLLESVFRERDLHIEALGAWAIAFQALRKQLAYASPLTVADRPTAQTSEETEELAVLWLKYHVAFIRLSTSLDPSELSYDRFLPRFLEIIMTSEAVLLPTAESAIGETKRQIFTVEMKFIHPLYFTALKCRHHGLRHRAVCLVRLSGKEGVWDGQMMARIAEHVIDQEEAMGKPTLPSEVTELSTSTSVGGLSDGEYIQPETLAKMSEISEYNRIHGVALDVDRVHRWVSVRCVKKNPMLRESEQQVEADVLVDVTLNDTLEVDKNWEWDLHEQTLAW